MYTSTKTSNLALFIVGEYKRQMSITACISGNISVNMTINLVFHKWQEIP